VGSVPSESARVGAGFDQGAGAYDEVMAHNRMGAERLVASLPEGTRGSVLDVGCGTGFASLACVRRLGARELVGVDVASEMLSRYREAVGAAPGVTVTTHAADVMAMPVQEGSFDAVVSSMAFHWFADKPGAVRAMARCLRPGGVLGILASGRGTDIELRAVLEAIRPPVPEAWLAVYDRVQRDELELEGYLRDAGMEPLDVWMERRRRSVPPERYLARVAITTRHLVADLEPDDLAALGARVRAGVQAAAGPEGFAYTFNKLYGTARRPP
jgi:ubiquinone/menaquinone biosynthesis C-methylase UbiE